MSDCERVRPAFGGFVLGGLEPEEFDEVEDHLASCAMCRDEVAELVELPALLDVAAEDPARAPGDLRQQVLRRAHSRRRGLLSVAAACLLLGLAIGAVGVTLVQTPPPADLSLTITSAPQQAVVGEAALRQVDAGVQLDLELTGVRPSDEGYYHAWLHRGERRVSAGTFVGPPDRVVDIQLLCGGRLEDYQRLTVTWHPQGADEQLAAQALLEP
jgi:anti-sigma factor RsiW